MGTVLYEYKFNFFQFMPVLIPLLVGLGFVFHRSVRNPKPFQRIISLIFRVVGLGVLIFGIALAVNGIQENRHYKAALTDGTALTVQGAVENYSLEQVSDADSEGDEEYSESFDIDGVHFTYGLGENTGGYDDTAKDGGVITGNGQRLKIKYYHYDAGDDTPEQNVILYIEQLN